MQIHPHEKCQDEHDHHSPEFSTSPLRKTKFSHHLSSYVIDLFHAFWWKVAFIREGNPAILNLCNVNNVETCCKIVCEINPVTTLLSFLVSKKKDVSVNHLENLLHTKRVLLKLFQIGKVLLTFLHCQERRLWHQSVQLTVIIVNWVTVIFLENETFKIINEIYKNSLSVNFLMH